MTSSVRSPRKWHLMHRSCTAGAVINPPSSYISCWLMSQPERDAKVAHVWREKRVEKIILPGVSSFLLLQTAHIGMAHSDLLISASAGASVPPAKCYAWIF